MITSGYPCHFESFETGWKCSVCGYIYPKMTSLPPQKVCNHSTPRLSRQHHTSQHEHLELGDLVEKALTAVGITKERVTKLLGRPCKCGQRQERLNELSWWAKRVLTGMMDNAADALDAILSPPVPPPTGPPQPPHEPPEPRDPKDITYTPETLCPKCKHYHWPDKTCHCKCSKGTPVRLMIERGHCPGWRW